MHAASIVAAAMALRGAPFLHHGRVYERGVDCVGLVLCSAWLAGLETPDFRDYGPDPDGDAVLRGMAGRLEPVACSDAGPGSVVRFALTLGGAPKHFGILVGDEMFVHADRKVGKVVVATLQPVWMRLFRDAFHLSGAVY